MRWWRTLYAMYLILKLIAGITSAEIAEPAAERLDPWEEKILYPWEEETPGVFKYIPKKIEIPFGDKYEIAADCGNPIINPTWINQDWVNLGSQFRGTEGTNIQVGTNLPSIFVNHNGCGKAVGRIISVNTSGVMIELYYHVP